MGTHIHKNKKFQLAGKHINPYRGEWCELRNRSWAKWKEVCGGHTKSLPPEQYLQKTSGTQADKWVPRTGILGSYKTRIINLDCTK